MKISISTEKDKQPPDEMITQLHASFRDSILSRESNFTPQIALLIAGLGGYFICLVKGYFIDIGVLYLVTYSSLLLSAFGYWLCILHGYQFRCDLYQLLKIEFKTGLSSYTLNYWPKYTRYPKKIEPPNIINGFKYAFIGFSIIVTISSSYVIINYYHGYISAFSRWIPENTFIMLLCSLWFWIIMISLFWIFSIIFIQIQNNKYLNRLRDIRFQEPFPLVPNEQIESEVEIKYNWCWESCLFGKIALKFKKTISYK